MIDILKEIFFPGNHGTKEMNKRNIALDKKICKEIEKYNKDFSETFFVSWVKSMFLRYAFLCSYEEAKAEKFEAIHLAYTANNDWREEMKLYQYFTSVDVSFIDLIDFTHTPQNDVLRVRLSVCGEGRKDIADKSDIPEKKSFFYEIEFIKENGEDPKLLDFTSNCPNCGAPTEIATFGICDHCKELISIYDSVWKIRKVEIHS